MREELKQVIARAEDCLEDARYLFEGNRNEAAVNRAYYAVFTAVQGLLLDKEVFVKTHAGAKVKFNELYIKTGLLPLDYGKIFENIFALRQEADYDFSAVISAEDSRQAIDDADKFIRGVKTFLVSLG